VARWEKHERRVAVERGAEKVVCRARNVGRAAAGVEPLLLRQGLAQRPGAPGAVGGSAGVPGIGVVRQLVRNVQRRHTPLGEVPQHRKLVAQLRDRVAARENLQRARHAV
jgi:hypothetical protein